MQLRRAGGISRTRGALLLSCMQASVAEFRRENSPDKQDKSERRGDSCPLRPAIASSAPGLPTLPQIVRDERLVDVVGDDCLRSKRSSARADAPDRSGVPGCMPVAPSPVSFIVAPP